MKLLICEDDISTINVIKRTIDFQKFHIDQLLEAYNGKMAMELFDAEKPELVLCDIGMPIIRGTEVLKYIRSKKNHTEFAFLTCYEDFKYAQMAIQYDAAGYVTKPFRIEEIEDILTKMGDNYQRKASLKKENQFKKDQLCSSLLKQISDGLFSDNKELIQRHLNNNEVPITVDSRWRIVFSCLALTDNVTSEWSRELLVYVTPSIHDEILNDYVGNAHAYVEYDDRFMWCITFVPSDQSQESLKAKSEQLIRFYDEHFANKPVVLISDEFALYDASHIMIDLYTTIRKIRYYAGNIFYQGVDINEDEEKTGINEEHVLWCLKNRDEAGYEEYMKNLLQKCESDNAKSQFKKEITSFYLTAIKDNGLSPSIIYEEESINELNKLPNHRDNLLKYSKELWAVYQRQISKMNDSEDIIIKARKFMDDNYRENIERDDVAKIAFVTPNYLSKLFRKNMGMNLREYINQLRIEESKRLLLSTNMSVSEIAIYVGYYNISYFSTVFHKLVGTSPSDYRNNERKPV